MCETSTLFLKSSCILDVPLQNYGDDFTFIVNGEKYNTSYLIADLLSPIISKTHKSDPTYNKLSINTNQKGNFSHILNLLNFDLNDVPQDEIPFISEVIKILKNESIEIIQPDISEITIYNVFSLLNMHEKSPLYNSNRFQEEIDFISSHLYELIEECKEELISLSIDKLVTVISNSKVQLNSENQLLEFINELYSQNSEYSILYETVHFENVSIEMVSEFIEVFDFNDMTASTWKSISNRLKQNTLKISTFSMERYVGKSKGEVTISPRDDDLFNGIIEFLRTVSKSLNSEIEITSSSFFDEFYRPINVVLFDDCDKSFHSLNAQNSWICFDFKNRKINLTDYVIRSGSWSTNSEHPKNWVIEGSNDNESWEVIDQQSECASLNGISYVHKFHVRNKMPNEFRYIRMKEIGPNWIGTYSLALNSIEFFGNLIL